MVSTHTVVVSLISIVLFYIAAAQGRKTLHTNNEFFASSPVTNNYDGICKTIVETQGYTCEEHTVNITIPCCIPRTIWNCNIK